MKWGRRVMGIARGRRRGRKFVNFAIWTMKPGRRKRRKGRKRRRRKWSS